MFTFLNERAHAFNIERYVTTVESATTSNKNHFHYQATPLHSFSVVFSAHKYIHNDCSVFTIEINHMHATV